MRRRTAALAGAALTALALPAAGQVGSDKPIETLSVAEVRALAVETGGAPGEVETTDDGYQLEIVYPDGLFVYFDGLNCTGAGETLRCPEFQMSVWFSFDSEAEALAKEHEIGIRWLSDMAFGSDLKVWRMDYLGGMTRGRMRGQFETFLDTVDVAREVAFGEDED